MKTVSCFALVTLLAAACASPGADPASASSLVATGDAGAPLPSVGTAGSHVGVHNMNLFGTGAGHLYLSHIPLYRQPHNVQALVEVAIVSGVPAAEQRFGTQGFTISPKPMSLSDFANGNLKNITATIYVGNLESGGRPAYRDVLFEVKQVVYRNALVRTMPESPSLAYIAVGSPSEAYLVHVIDRAPSFEQILAVSLPPDSFLTAADLAGGKIIAIAGSTSEVTARLSKGDAVDAVAPTGSKITVTTELTCLPGEDFYGNCPAATH